MKTIRELRHENFKRLLQMWKERVWEQFPSHPERGMMRKMAVTFGLSERFLSHMNCDIKPMGSRVARNLEELMGLQVGWMDTDHSTTIASEQQFVERMMQIYKSSPQEATRLMRATLIDKTKGRLDE